MEKSKMEKTFIEIKLFQVKPDKLELFEEKIREISADQMKCEGCISLKYFKRFYTIDGIELGEPPRELTKIVKCVKYYSCWEFDTKENYGKAIKVFFDKYNKDLQKLLIAPFDINLGYSILETGGKICARRSIDTYVNNMVLKRNSRGRNTMIMRSTAIPKTRNGLP